MRIKYRKGGAGEEAVMTKTQKSDNNIFLIQGGRSHLTKKDQVSAPDDQSFAETPAPICSADAKYNKVEIIIYP